MHKNCCVHCPRKRVEPPDPSQSMSACIERFVTAKKFHAENLQHHPLPDRCDDAIFKIKGDPEYPCMYNAIKGCQKIMPRHLAEIKKRCIRSAKFIPVLGCKTPRTYMDLAICWETPLDPNYEPRRAPHIDGSDGGSAPAVFNLVQHSAPKIDVRDGTLLGWRPEDDDNQKDSGCCQHCRDCLKERLKAETEDNDLCKELDSMCIATGKNVSPKERRTHFQRHCVGCEEMSKSKVLARTTRSANCVRKPVKSNGLPRMQVPRPRTPYARRSFCIDSLSPPFSIIKGYRDTDFPENWRLTSIYQQSYRHPKKMREGRTLLKYDRLI